MNASHHSAGYGDEADQAPRTGGLAALFKPRAIAVVGASETPGLARDLLMTLRSRGFDGAVYAVNPRHARVLDEPCFPDVRSIPAAVDLAIVLVPPGATPTVLTDCAEARVPGVVVCSSGYAEIGDDGRTLQAQVGHQARAGGLSLLGPNSIGFVNVLARIPALAIPPASVPADLRHGPVSIVSQSGGVMISMMEYGAQIGLGYSYLISTGNEEQIGATDCLHFLLDDPATRVIALVLETVRDGRCLLDLAARARATDRAVVALKLGRSVRGAEAVRTHTAALAGSAEVFEAACRDAGIEVVESISSLVDTVAFLAKRRPGTRGGLAAITISGGTKALVADLAERHGVRLADLGKQTQERLVDVLPQISTIGNPLDVTAASIEDDSVCARVVETLADDPAVGVIALVMHLRKGGGSPAHQRLIRTFVAQHARVSKQLAVISTIPEGVSGFWRQEAAAGPVPFLNDLSAISALRGITAPAAPMDWPRTTNDPIPIPASLGALSRSLTGEGLLADVDAYPLLTAAGIDVAPYAVVRSRDQAVAAAERLGFPVALKGIAGIAHKMAAGLVHLHLTSADDVARAYDALESVPLPTGIERSGALVQAMIQDGVELLVGIRLDLQFGPVVVVGLGGVWAEALRDVQFALAPADTRQILALLDRLRAAGVLRDLGARAKIDLQAVAEAASRLSRLADQLAPRLAALEINPLIARADGCVAADALGWLRRDGGVFDRLEGATQCQPLQIT